MAFYSNVLFLTVGDGETAIIPIGTLWFAMNPSTGASFTITNSAPVETGKNTGTSGPISTPFSSGECPNAEGWNQHTITASAGTVYISYVTGQ